MLFNDEPKNFEKGKNYSGEEIFTFIDNNRNSLFISNKNQFSFPYNPNRFRNKKFRIDALFKGFIINNNNKQLNLSGEEYTFYKITEL
jgi:hypothetical protein